MLNLDKSKPKFTGEPLRAEVYGIERLEEHARACARADRIAPPKTRGKPLLPRLIENSKRLQYAQEQFTAAQAAAILPAAEWLLDNYYVVETQINQVRHDLSANYYRELPKLADGPEAGLPRAYHLALELILHTDSRLDQEVLTRFVRAYQENAPLSIGELWATGIMLRIALIENLRRLIDEALAVLEMRQRADRDADRLLKASEEVNESVAGVAKSIEKSAPLRNPTYVTQLMQRLRDTGPSVAPALNWLETQMEARNQTLETVIREENQQRALNRVAVGNVITSMRLLNSLDWNIFFEDTSLVEAILRRDPASAYAETNGAARDRYRTVIETLARHDPKKEMAAAEAAVALAGETPATATAPDQLRRRHVGYYLIDNGLPALRTRLQYQPPLGIRWEEATRRYATPIYLGSIALLTALLVAGVVGYANAHGAAPEMLVLVALLALIPMSVLAVGSINWTLTVELPPNPPPKLTLKDGVPAQFRTMVVIPALIVNLSGLEFLLENLELRFLANRDDNLHFAILGDFADAPQEHMPEDQSLIDAASEGIRTLNQTYGRADAFFFLSRRRQWNEGEQRWMGWERKRGKLDEFNRLLRGATDTSYVYQVGETSILPRIKYVITLDADTELPLHVALRLIGASAHPLNQPVLHPVTRHVIEGYGIIQPRVDVGTPSADRSRFSQVFTGDTGLDPYSSTVSNVYQDLFQRAVYIGKAIYDVDAILGTLHDRFPENTLLSHDLLESGFARAGLASDIELLEDFPSSYDTFMQRNHRWVRGDWQITSWLFPKVKDAKGQWQPNPLPVIDRWKIFDNLRRSLVPAAVVLLLFAGWTILPGTQLFWTVLGLFAIMFPFIRGALMALGDRPGGEALRGYLITLAQELWIATQRALITVVMLMHYAIQDTDAIVRVLWRRAVSHRKLLEWTSAAQAEHGQARTLGNYFARMWLSPALAIFIGAVVAWVRPAALVYAFPLLLMWLLAPTVAYSMSQPLKLMVVPLPDKARRELRATARRTWRFYEQFAGAEDHWLPPDNFQIEPKRMIAHRTSPTNVGFLLLSTVAAYDFGYIDAREGIERIERVLQTLEQLERYQGHFFNWYDTTTLQPLLPQYVSTVDSGNLAASLIALKQAVGEWTTSQSNAVRTREGLRDTVAILNDTITHIPKARGPRAPDTSKALDALQQEVERLNTLLQRPADVETAAEAPPLSADAPTATVLADDQIERATRKLVRLAQVLQGQDTGASELQYWCDALVRQAKLSRTAGVALAPDLIERCQTIARQAEALVGAMDYQFLYDPGRGLFRIGFNVTNNRRDDNYYDLLASEARLTSFVTIARGEIPERHWFRLGRPLFRSLGKTALLSWGGTMFEYLMPPLLLSDFTPSLLQQSQRAAIQEQIGYGAQNKIPWGISESGFYAFDYQSNYQYRAFGVPQLGLKREPLTNLVVAPYATFLALPYAPHAAWKNLQALAEYGALGGYGYFEALDFTPERLPKGQKVGIVRSYMAHHQGMSLVALDNFFNHDIMRERFRREPMMAAAELLLQERVPRHAPVLNITQEERPMLRASEDAQPPLQRDFDTPHTYAPRAHLLSNGEYTVMVTNSGGGYSAVGETRVTRWRQDATAEPWGSFCYIKDLSSGRVWSNTYQPVCVEPDAYRVQYKPDTVEFARQDGGVETKTEIFVSPERNAEIRQVTLSNRRGPVRMLELTSYAEVVLDTARGEESHPAFSKLFVESEFVPDHKLLLFQRRPRSDEQRPIWAAHLLFSETPGVTVREYETARVNFLGRGRTVADPIALYGRLSNTTGAVLDPVMSLRTRVRLAPGTNVTLSFVTCLGESREQVLALCNEYLDERDIERAKDLAQAHSQIEMRHLGISKDDALVFQRLSSRVLFPDPNLHMAADGLPANTQGQAALWAYGISGDYPIVLVRLESPSGLGLVRKLLLAHEYWRLHNLKVDLVIVDMQSSSYDGVTTNQINDIVNSSLSRPWLDKPSGIFVRQRDQMGTDDFRLLETAAHVILNSDLGELGEQINLSARNLPAIGAHAPARAPVTASAATPKPADGLQAFNGLGGLSADGKEYVIRLNAGEWTPAPWSNVLANPEFGCLVSDAGPGFSWAGNSQQNKLTPWSNDPVSDPPPEAIYLQDRETNEVWSPTPLPIRDTEPYVVRHGAGYSIFEHSSRNLEQRLQIRVDTTDPVKVIQLTLKNTSQRRRRLRVTYYAEWVLGMNRTDIQQFGVTEYDAAAEALLARNPYNTDFQTRLAFAATLAPLKSWTSDRLEFLGRNGSLTLPAALTATAKPLSKRAGAGVDPCAVLQTEVELEPGQEKEIVFLLGEGMDRAHVHELLDKYRQSGLAQAVRQAVDEKWDGLLGTVQVKTPDRAMNALLNRWLLYQALACRVWGRSAFYQSGGAYGFRDQLQDVMALVYAAPLLAREHILRAAAHQFEEGDVQHWWHPPAGKGVRTRISDDYLWLPYVVEHYVRTTGDAQILDEAIPFLRMPLLAEHQDEIYGEPEITSETATLYEHCVRAVDHGLRYGEHGLPLMGTGDWNDGMNRVGAGGKGESVWLGWFLYSNLTAFSELAEARGDKAHAANYRAQAETLQRALDEHGWDGEWFRRAYFDDGTPLGSAQNPECQIDSIAQSWSVISRAGTPERQAQALRSAEQRLVREKEGLLLLLTPPFDHMQPNPGYIQGYVPGIRENGGQYTHGTLWLLLAYTMQGNGERATELFALLNPLNHAKTPEQVAQYKVEPYVIAADVYSHPQHLGRGGWTWYTGSAAWMYRIGVEHILGLQRRGNVLHIEPCIPPTWQTYALTYRFGSARYEVSVENPNGVMQGVAYVEFNGQPCDDQLIPLVDDGQVHPVRVVMGAPQPKSGK